MLLPPTEFREESPKQMLEIRAAFKNRLRLTPLNPPSVDRSGLCVVLLCLKTPITLSYELFKQFFLKQIECILAMVVFNIWSLITLMRVDMNGQFFSVGPYPYYSGLTLSEISLLCFTFFLNRCELYTPSLFLTPNLVTPGCQDTVIEEATMSQEGQNDPLRTDTPTT